MAINTKTLAGKVVDEAAAPEGYEFVSDSEGRIAIKKIRNSVKKAIKETTEAVEAVTDVAKTIVEVIKPKSKKVSK